MRKRVLSWSILAAVVVLATLRLMFPRENLDFTTSSHGKARGGFGAAFDLLAELGVPVARSYVPPDLLPPGATVWWVDSEDLCEDAEAEGQSGDSEAREVALPPEPWPGRRWLEEGGTAVLFLPAWIGEDCASIAGVQVPAVADLEDDEDAAPAKDGEPGSVVAGTITGAPRRLSVSLGRFEAPGDGTVVAWLAERPFALEFGVGSGRLVVVADATFVRNAHLDEGDAAPLVADLARAYGAPVFDEYSHGLTGHGSAPGYLLRSAALPLFAGLALLGVLIAWRGNAWPARSVADARPGAPTLDRFVESLAELYARSRDYDSVLEHYRHLTVQRLRRHYALAPETSASVISERLRADRRLVPEDLRPLERPAGARSRAELNDVAEALDSLVWKATR